MKADLHMHSTASDGLLAPDALMALAAQRGFTHVALTDHDSMAGIPLAQEAARSHGMQLIPGVELSCGAQKEIHILGYGCDPENGALKAFCAQRRAQREKRAEDMVEKLCALGLPVDMRRVRELAGGVIARPHVARAMLEAGHVASVDEAFERYLKLGRPAYVPRPAVRVADALCIVAQAGGIAVLAHPMELKMGETQLESLMEEWKAQGLAGVEVYHPSAQSNHAASLLRLARRLGLLVTGGSDYHGEALHRGEIGEGLERWQTVERDMQALLSRIQTTNDAKGER